MQAVDHMDDEALEALKQKIAQAQAARKPQESAEEAAAEPFRRTRGRRPRINRT